MTIHIRHWFVGLSLVAATVIAVAVEEQMAVEHNIGQLLSALGSKNASDWSSLYDPLKAKLDPLPTAKALERYSHSLPFCQYQKDSSTQSHLTFELGLGKVGRICADGIDVFVNFSGTGEKVIFQHHHEDV